MILSIFCFVNINPNIIIKTLAKRVTHLTFRRNSPFYQIEEDVSKNWIVQNLEPLFDKYILCLK